MSSPSLPEPKTNCIFCGCSFLQRTADMTGGYCKGHQIEIVGRGEKTIIDCEVDFETVTRSYQNVVREFRRYRDTSWKQKAPPLFDSKEAWAEYRCNAQKGCRHFRFHAIPDEGRGAFTITEGFLAVHEEKLSSSIIISCDVRPADLECLRRLLRRNDAHGIYSTLYSTIPHDEGPWPENVNFDWMLPTIAGTLFVLPILEERARGIRQKIKRRNYLKSAPEPEEFFLK